MMQMPDYSVGQAGAMGSAGETFGSSNMAPFLTKLFQIVSAGTTDHCIQWTMKGDSFVISDPDTFARDILPTYFKHNNIRSFIRQLNTYGFRKRTNISSTDEHLEFFHAKFRRDDPQGLTQIKRCHQPKPQAGAPRGGGTMAAMPEPQSDCNSSQYNPDLDTIRSRVTELKTRLGSLQSEIRDYNQQMEQKVNLLMHILQTSAPPGGGQAGNRLQAPAPAVAPVGNGSGVGAAHGAAGAAGLPSSQGPASSAAATGMSNDLMGRRESLLASLGQQSALNGAGLGSLGGAMGSLGAAGLGVSGLGATGLGAAGLGGGLGASLGGGLGAGIGALCGLGGTAGLGSLGGCSTCSRRRSVSRRPRRGANVRAAAAASPPPSASSSRFG